MLDGLISVEEEVVRDEGSSLLSLSSARLGRGLEGIHPQFYASLAGVSEEEMIGGLEDRGYQLSITRAIKEKMLGGLSRGQLVVGTGGGKTAIAMNVIGQTEGKVLWVAPSNVAVDRADEEVVTLGIEKPWQRLGEKDGKLIDPSADMVLGTWQMLLYGDRFKDIDPTHFSLVVFDEAHHFLGSRVREVVEWFKAYQLHMTATPDNTSSSVSDSVPERFATYSSDELVDNNGYPPWLLYRHEVEGERLYDAELVGDKYSIKEGGEKKYLNMSGRYAICLKILRDAAEAKEKTMVYLPSVNSSREFVDEVAKKDPVLKDFADKIAYVDGKIPKEKRKEMQERFNLPFGHPDSLIAVVGKDVWTESLDVPEISNIVLADPCTSARVMFQRIGRGSRPVDGKTHLKIHDVVSTVNRVDVRRFKNGKTPTSVAGMMGIRNYSPGIVVTGMNSGLCWDNDTNLYTELPVKTSVPVSFSERNLNLTVLEDKSVAFYLMEEFAKLLNTDVHGLVIYPDAFFDRKELMVMKRPDGSTFDISYKDFYDALAVFGTLDFVKEKALQGVEALRARIHDELMASAEIQKTEEIGRVILDDPFDMKRVPYMLCPDESMRKVFKYIFREINRENSWSRDNSSINFSYEWLKGRLPKKVYKDLQVWANPDKSYKGMGDITEIAAFNGIDVQYGSDGIRFEVFDSRRSWECWYHQEPTFLSLDYLAPGEVEGESPGPGLDKYCLRSTRPPFQRVHKSLFLFPGDSVDDDFIGMCHEDTFKLIVEAKLAGKEYIVIPKGVVDNSIEIFLGELTGLFGQGHVTDWQPGGENKWRGHLPHYMLNVVQLPDGGIRVPIHHVKVYLGGKGVDADCFEPAAGWNKANGNDEWELLWKREKQAEKFCNFFGGEMEEDFDILLREIGNRARVKDSMDEPDWSYQFTSSKRGQTAGALAKLYGIEFEFYTKDKYKTLLDMHTFSLNMGEPAEAPMGARLVEYSGSDEDPVMGIEGILQRQVFDGEINQSLLKMIYDALKNGEEFLCFKFKHVEDLDCVCDCIWELRRYLQTFGYQGDILAPDGLVGAKGFKLSLQGLSV